MRSATAAEAMIHVFEQPLPDGLVYPCSKCDIENRLAALPCQDVEGIWAVGLARATKSDLANARYLPLPKPTIELYSWPSNYEFSLQQGTKVKKLLPYYGVELSFGMQLRQDGSRVVLHWNADDLRQFMLNHVLLHEVGHHVFAKQRQASGHSNDVSSQAKEQFAEAYASRYSRK